MLNRKIFLLFGFICLGVTSGCGGGIGAITSPVINNSTGTSDSIVGTWVGSGAACANEGLTGSEVETLTLTFTGDNSSGNISYATSYSGNCSSGSNPPSQDVGCNATGTYSISGDNITISPLQSTNCPGDFNTSPNTSLFSIQNSGNTLVDNFIANFPLARSG